MKTNSNGYDIFVILNVFNLIIITIKNGLILDTSLRNKIIFSVARDILNDIDKDKWLQKVMSPGNALNGNKLRTYRQYKTVLKTESYVKQTMSRGHRRVLAKFLSCTLPLAIEIGRYTRPKTPIY